MERVRNIIRNRLEPEVGDEVGFMDAVGKYRR